jgi:hypothetical protein
MSGTAPDVAIWVYRAIIHRTVHQIRSNGIIVPIPTKHKALSKEGDSGTEKLYASSAKRVVLKVPSALELRNLQFPNTLHWAQVSHCSWQQHALCFKAARGNMVAGGKPMGTLMRVLCALALLFVGLSHKPPAIAASTLTPTELAAYTLPDGTVPVLCLPAKDGASKKHSHDFGFGCEACRLASAILLPAPPTIDSSIVISPADRFVPVRYEAFYRQLFPPNASPRAPPLGLIA